MPSQPFRTARRSAALAGLALLALVAPLAVAAPASAAGVPKPTSITVTARTDPGIAARLSGVPSASLPEVLAAAGTPFVIDVALWNGAKPAAYPTATPVSLEAPGPGQLDVAQATIPAGASSVTAPPVPRKSARFPGTQASDWLSVRQLAVAESQDPAPPGSFPECHTKFGPANKSIEKVAPVPPGGSTLRRVIV